MTDILIRLDTEIARVVYENDKPNLETLLLDVVNEIERLRDALRLISHAPHGKIFCRDGHEEAYWIARTALREEKS